MPHMKNLVKTINHVSKGNKKVNWFPGHMYSGMQAMIGKLNTVDCIIEVHDARLPFTGRNEEFRKHLGLIKPRILVLNKSDLADLSRWDVIKRKLRENGDQNVFLTDLTGSSFSFGSRGYTSLLENVIKVINESDRFNRAVISDFKVMIVGIPNVGKSTLINRLRQQHLGKRGEPAKTGPEAGVTRHVNNMIRICTRPPIYSLDTPGILEPSSTKDREESMRLALCSTISDKVVDPVELAQFLLDFLNEQENYAYQSSFEMDKPAVCLEDLIRAASTREEMLFKVKAIDSGDFVEKPHVERICWKFIREFRQGLYGKVMFN